MKKTKENKGITLVALTVTIIVLIILSGVSAAMLVGENGLITRTRESKFKTELSGLKEELEEFKLSKMIENKNFQESSLTSGIGLLKYNTKKQDEQGDIENILTSIKEHQKEKIEIIKGKMYYKTDNEQEIKWLQDLGIEKNPYDIENGELKSSYENLKLLDENGTIVVPASVTKIGRGAFTNLKGLETVIVPGTCKEIDIDAFANNQTLKNVILEDGVTTIGAQAFKGCSNLENVQMTDSVERIRICGILG